MPSTGESRGDENTLGQRDLQGEDGPFTISAATFRAVEEALSEPLFCGIPLGSTLNDCLQIDFLDSRGDWRRRAQLLNRARWAKYQIRPLRGDDRRDSIPSERILLTWYQATPRYDELLLPVLDEIGTQRCAVIHGDPRVADRLPREVPRTGRQALSPRDRSKWRTEFQKCWPHWREALKTCCRLHDLPTGALELLAHCLQIASQRVVGSVEFLEQIRPQAILTEYDRNNLWSCLVLAARHLQIPSVTLVHGVMRQDALTFAPVLADRILCWGSVDREKLLAAGEPPGKVLAVGCPRLDRDLSFSQAQARSALGLPASTPVVMYATSTDHLRLAHAEMFCQAVENLVGVQSLVRLHPSENLAIYDSLIRRHPKIRFAANQEASVDMSLAATDVVVVSATGFGSDALVKRRPVIVLHSHENLVGQNRDLVAIAKCPHARTSFELLQSLLPMLRDSVHRDRKMREADKYVNQFCAAFGPEAAEQIALLLDRVVLQAAGQPA